MGLEWGLNGAYGAALAIKVVVEIWARIGALKHRPNEDEERHLCRRLEDFLDRFEGVNDEALVVELDDFFNACLGGEEENSRGFSRLMAARLMRLMVVEYKRELDAQARATVEGAALPPLAVERDEVNYLAEEDGILSEMGQIAASR